MSMLALYSPMISSYFGSDEQKESLKLVLNYFEGYLSNKVVTAITKCLTTDK